MSAAAAALLGSSFVAPALADNAFVSSSGEVAASADLACLSTSVDARESAVINARAAFHAGIMTALTARRDALKAALTITNNKDRQVAFRAAWDAFLKTSARAREQYKTDIKAAWKVFFDASAKCNLSLDRGDKKAMKEKERGKDRHEDDDDDSKEARRDHKDRGLHLGQWRKALGGSASVKAGTKIDLSY
ncbi:MAG: hypothetical protein Greene041619_726 [Candidatus Peregrinibacteria bacterium Greene0416_19]|nr:MAG: hypothetical protein Greene041619_726 [Candidatus Peregrinibacteria bacterium Greene0416_19]